MNELVHLWGKPGTVNHLLKGESIRSLGRVYIQRYEALGESSRDAGLDARIREEKRKFKLKTQEDLVDVHAIVDLFEAFDKDRRQFYESY